MKHGKNELIKEYEEGKRFTFLPFWEGDFHADAIRESCLSQWYPCVFTVDGVEYTTAEQYMMAQKALLFGDREIFGEIMKADTPEAFKALGRKVRGFDESVWEAHRFEIVVAGNTAKFSQNEALKAYLLGTGDAVLVEASPYDTVWGIGMCATDKGMEDPRCWWGENLLGFALMEVREILRNGK